MASTESRTVSYPFSARTRWDLSEGELAGAVRERRAAQQPVYDLTVSNPTACGLEYDSLTILGPLGAPAGLTYDPDPRGQFAARAAVAAYYAGHGAQVSEEDLILTTSTSEAYSFLFRLLADAGDSILAAQPSYPLFDFLARLDDVCLDSYPLFYDFGWWIDFAELERKIGPRTRAIVLVHPNNPTGHCTLPAERMRLEQLCADKKIALIVDEVFLDYPVDPQLAPQSFARGPHPCLTFVVSGLSKIAALPQMKLAWVAVFGPEQERVEALARLEVIADTFLSLSTPVQHALSAWLQTRQPVTDQILQRVRQSLAILDRHSIPWLPFAAGWNAILKLPVTRTGIGDRSEDTAQRLVREAGILTHPGSFYGLTDKNQMVISLISPLATFEEGVRELKRWVQSNGLTMQSPS